MKNILMIDIETTGTKPGCKVLSVGAFGFNTNGEQVELYERISYNAQMLIGLTDDKSTIEWWNKQNPKAKEEAFGGKCGPKKFTDMFFEWFGQNFYPRSDEGFSVWCNGLDFDFPILKEFFRIADGCTVLPWNFWLQNDYRTIKNMFPEIRKAEGNVEKHNALEDAKAQMRGLREFFNTYKSNKEN